MLAALRQKDRRVLFTLGTQDQLAAFALGLHLLFHRILNFTGRDDVFQLHAVDLDAPRIGSLIQNGAHTRVDRIARGKRTVKIQLTNHITKRGSGKIFNGENGVGHVQLAVGDLIIHDRVDLHTYIILGNDRLRREVHDLLHQIDAFADAVNERDLQVKTVLPGFMVRAKSLNDVGVRLRHDVNVGDHGNEHQDQNNYNSNNRSYHSNSPFYNFNMALFYDQLNALDLQHRNLRAHGDHTRRILGACRPAKTSHLHLATLMDV